MIELRVERPEDTAAIREVHRLAFLREAEGDMVDSLREAGMAVLSMVAEDAAEIVGHVLYSPVILETEEGDRLSLLGLAPVAVSPSWQGQGVGTRLIQSSLERLRSGGHPAVVVLGDQGFCARFGFAPGSGWGLRWDKDATEGRLMVAELAAGSLGGLRGTVCFRPEFERGERPL